MFGLSGIRSLNDRHIAQSAEHRKFEQEQAARIAAANGKPKAIGKVKSGKKK